MKTAKQITRERARYNEKRARYKAWRAKRRAEENALNERDRRFIRALFNLRLAIKAQENKS